MDAQAVSIVELTTENNVQLLAIDVLFDDGEQVMLSDPTLPLNDKMRELLAALIAEIRKVKTNDH